MGAKERLSFADEYEDMGNARPATAATFSEVLRDFRSPFERYTREWLRKEARLAVAEAADGAELTDRLDAAKFVLDEFLSRREGDRVGLVFENGQVQVPDCFRRPYELFVEGEWTALTADPDFKPKRLAKEDLPYLGVLFKKTQDYQRAQSRLNGRRIN